MKDVEAQQRVLGDDVAAEEEEADLLADRAAPRFAMFVPTETPQNAS